MVLKFLRSWPLLLIRLAPLVLTLACGQDETKSDLTWSHTTTERATGSIPAMLAYQELGFNSDENDISVCIQESPSYKGSQLLLETKLAYASWLNASGRGTQSNWERFRFQISPRCRLNDTAFTSHVVIASLEKSDASQSDNFTIINCSERSCFPNGYTTGWGGPATINYRYYTANPSRWASVSLYAPAIARLSPYLRWQSLDAEFKLQLRVLDGRAMTGRAPKLTVKQLQYLADRYEELRVQAKTASLADLVAYSEKLATYRADSKADFRIVNTRSAESSPLYQMQYAGYHTLLHEVGHQFGMMHAHVKSGYTDNGAVKGTDATKKDGTWTTDEAAMAYDNSYFFLTADDRAGIRNLTTNLYAYLRAKL